MAESFRCAQCGAEVPGDAPQGLCPNCVLAAGFPTDGGPLAGLESEGETTLAANFIPPAPEDLAPHFPELEIIELVGRGGMGVVYKARQKRLNRLVALKILAPKIALDPAFAERFVREARALAMLNHPHIVAVHDFGQTSAPLKLLDAKAEREEEQNAGGDALTSESSGPVKEPAECPLYYFVMEYVDGVNLRRLLETEKISPQQALSIVPQICTALQFAHDAGVVHRDIKPENILLDKHGQVKIADFGIAKLMGRETSETTETGSAKRSSEEEPASTSEHLTTADQVIGTPQYMAPEQIEHPQEVDHRADIYSLGVVFYQMLTGELPVGKYAPPSKKVEIDVRLDEVVLRAMEKEPERRYQQVSEVKTQVENITTTPYVPAESAAQTSESGSPANVSKCYLSTPEHLRSLFGRFFWIYKAKGELRLDSETLRFSSGWQTVVIPLESIRGIAQGDYPYSAKPYPLHYIEVTFLEYGAERTLLFTPMNSATFLPDSANKIAAEWISSLQKAVRAKTGRTIDVELSRVVQDKFWVVKTLLAGVGFIFVLWLAQLILYQQLPDSLGAKVTNAIIAILVISIIGIILGWRRRSAFIIGNHDPLAEEPPGPHDTNGTPTDIDTNAAARARDQVKGPAIGLLVTGILAWLTLPAILYMVSLTAPALQQQGYPGHHLAVVPVLLMIFSSLMIFAGLKMRRLQAYGLAVTGGILAMIVSPSNLVGLPIGIWALVVLSQRDVRAAFAREKFANNHATPYDQSQHSGVAVPRLLLSGFVFFLAIAWTFISNDIDSVIQNPTLENICRTDHVAAIAISVGLLVLGLATLFIHGRNATRVILSTVLVCSLLCIAVLVTSQANIAKALRSFNRAPGPDNSVPGPEVTGNQRKGPWIVLGPDNIKVELLGVCENINDKDDRWWSPDGTPLADRPCKSIRHAASGKDELSRGFAVRLSNLPPEPASMYWMFKSPGASMEQTTQISPVETAQSGGQVVRCKAASFPKTKQTANIHLCVASGPWCPVSEKVCNAKSTSDGMDEMPGGMMGPAGPSGIIFSEPYEKNSEVNIHFSHPLHAQGMRVVAVCIDGREIPTFPVCLGISANKRQSKVVFPELSLKDVYKFRVESREYQIVSFDDVKLHPRRQPDDPLPQKQGDKKITPAKKANKTDKNTAGKKSGADKKSQKTGSDKSKPNEKL